MGYIKLCKNCRSKLKEDDFIEDAYLPWLYDDDYECPECNGKLVDTIITTEEYMALSEVSNQLSFFEAMIKLKQEDLIEFQLKMAQFKTQLKQQEQMKNIEQKSNIPKCPHCQSTNIKPISGLNRGASIAMLGIFSKKINKSFECKHCGYTW